MISMIRGIGLCGILAAWCPLHAQLIQNGGFETGTFQNWNLSGTAHVQLGTPASNYVYSGSHGATLGSGILSQAFVTTPGQVYRVSFELNAILYTWPGPIEARWGNFSIPPGLDLGEVTLFSSSDIPALGWYKYSYDVLALGNVGSLEFEFQTQAVFYPDNAALDSVSVMALGNFAPLPDLNGVPIGGTSPALPSTTPYLIASSITALPTPVAVPEASTYGLLGALALLLVAAKRRFIKARQ